MLFAEIAAQCAPQIPLELMAAVVSVESRFDPLALRIDGKLGLAKSAGDGVASVVGSTDDGAAVAIGLAGLTEAALRAERVGIADAFDACANLKVAAARLDRLLKAAEAKGLGAAAAEKAALAQAFVPSSFRGWNAGGYVIEVQNERARLMPLLATLKIDGVSLPSRAAASTGSGSTTAATPGTKSGSDAVAARPSWSVYGAPPHGGSLMVFDKQQAGAKQ